MRTELTIQQIYCFKVTERNEFLVSAELTAFTVFERSIVGRVVPVGRLVPVGRVVPE